MKLYSTVRGQAQAEQVVEKSRFIAYVSPAETREEADAFIASIRKKHKDATHNVPAVVLGDKFQIQWASDDGEPQGTSGAPIVQFLVNEGITNVVIVVTRYFGGIKLGTGGLVRAYTSSAKLGIEAAGICHVEEMCALTYEIDYTYLSKLQNISSEGLFDITDIVYTHVVQVTLCLRPENLDEVTTMVKNLTAGKGILKNQRLELVKN
ncbi:MAG: YigZ family protein [Firmicutes bacterium]|nr:YigZ family protein [Bacillota bacterium]